MFKILVLTFSFVLYLWENFLSIRQHFKLQAKCVVPKQLDGKVKKEEMEKASLYGLDKSSFAFFTGLFSLAQTFVLLYFDLLPFFWSKAANLSNKIGFNSEIPQSLIFMVILGLISTLLSFPFSVYQNFVIEEKHGFNKQTFSLFLADKIKQVLLLIALGLPFLGGFLFIVKSTGDRFYFYVWLFLYFDFIL